MLRSADILAIDELGLVSLNDLRLIDIVLRSVRNDNRPFGGILVIATGDYCQLPCPKGQLVWSSVTLMTTFDIYGLKHLVRSMDDQFLQQIIELTRRNILSEDEISLIVRLVGDNCNFVSSFQDVPEMCTKVVSKVKSALKLIGEISKLRHTSLKMENARRASQKLPLLKSATFVATDEYEMSTGQWGPATPNVTRLLNSNVRELPSIFLVEGDLMRVTRNEICPTPRYSQGQTCRVVSISFDEDMKPRSVSVEMTSPGTNDFPEAQTIVKFSQIPSQNVIVGTQMTTARRIQLPLVNAEIMTIHKCIGNTYDVLACRVSQKDETYAMWMREQFITIVSRVRSLKDLYWVGEKEDVLNAIGTVLRKRPRHWAAISKMLTAANQLNAEYHVPISANLPLKLDSHYMPGAEIPVIYMAVSTRFKEQFHIGKTSNLIAHLHDLNNLVPVEETQKMEVPPNNCVYRPWVALLYIMGAEFHLSPEEMLALKFQLTGETIKDDSYSASKKILHFVQEWNKTQRRKLLLVETGHINVLAP